MARRLRWLALLALASVAVGALLAGVASGAPAIRPAPGVPDPKLMVLTSGDLAGAKVTKQGYYKDRDFPSVISYSRELENGSVGGVGLLYVDSEAEVGTSPASTARYLAMLRTFLGTKAGRKLLAGSFASELPASGAVSNPHVGRPRNIGVGPGSFDLTITVRVLGVRAEAHVASFRVERVLGAVIAVGVPGKRVPVSVMSRLAKIMVARMMAELSPKNTSPPTIAGTPAIGQTLTAAAGAWSGSPTSFAYQWQRCDAGGSACASIAGATSQSYAVVAADTGATLRVTVTARNASGTGTASSAATAVVQAAGAPVNTAPPTISGTAQVGQTLTAGTGTWTGGPTSYGFQWQRCNPSGASCVPIAGALGGTYVVGAADVGSTLSVVVTATNTVGSASATSAATTTVT